MNKNNQSINSENNFVLAAEMTTKYYLELKRNYEEKFSNKQSLLAAAGILDAGHYISVEKTMEAREIIKIAKESAKSDYPLVDFIIELETKMFSIDSPELSIAEVREACSSQRGAIKKTIDKTVNEYEGENMIKFAVKTFMNSNKAKEHRDKLNIDGGDRWVIEFIDSILMFAITALFSIYIIAVSGAGLVEWIIYIGLMLYFYLK